MNIIFVKVRLFFGRLFGFNCKIPQKISLRTSHIQNASMLALLMMKLKKPKVWFMMAAKRISHIGEVKNV
jgi:hypothetical protein